MPVIPAPPKNSAYSDQPNAASTPTLIRVSMVAAPCRGIAPGGAVERPRPPHHDRRGEGQAQPLPVVELPRRDHRQHEDRQRQSSGDEQPLPQRRRPRRPRRSRRTAVGLHRPHGARWCRERCGVTGGLDGGDRGGHLGAGRQHDVGLLGRVVDGRLDPGHPVELLLDPGGARRARHATDLQINRLLRHAVLLLWFFGCCRPTVDARVRKDVVQGLSLPRGRLPCRTFTRPCAMKLGHAART